MTPINDEPLGVVVVDDDPAYRELICAMTSAHSKFTLHEVASGAELDHVLSQETIDCIVLDYELGQESGLSVKQRIDVERPDHAPVVMLTGAAKEETAIRAFRLGVADYLPKKGLKPAQLVETIARVVKQDREKAQEKARYLRLVADSAVDVITGLEGRPLLDERLKRLEGLSPQSKGAFAVFVIELAGYDRIVERFGLKGADQALRKFAETLRRLTRSNDVVGRYVAGTFLMIANVNQDTDFIDIITARLTRGLTMTIDVESGSFFADASVSGGLCAPGAPGEPTFPALLLAHLRDKAVADGASPAHSLADCGLPDAS